MGGGKAHKRREGRSVLLTIMKGTPTAADVIMLRPKSPDRKVDTASRGSRSREGIWMYMSSSLVIQRESNCTACGQQDTMIEILCFRASES